jgi:hypothetical protein
LVRRYCIPRIGYNHSVFGSLDRSSYVARFNLFRDLWSTAPTEAPVLLAAMVLLDRAFASCLGAVAKQFKLNHYCSPQSTQE